MSPFWRGFWRGFAQPIVVRRWLGPKPTQLCSRCHLPTAASLDDPRVRERELAQAERYGYVLAGCVGAAYAIGTSDIIGCRVAYYEYCDE